MEHDFLTDLYKRTESIKELKTSMEALIQSDRVSEEEKEKIEKVLKMYNTYITQNENFFIRLHENKKVDCQNE